MMISIKGKRSCSGSLKWRTMILIWAKLGLLEVLRLLVRMPGEGDVTALPCFTGELRKLGILEELCVVESGRGNVRGNWEEADVEDKENRGNCIS
jgi:hypothetical protein